MEEILHILIDYLLLTLKEKENIDRKFNLSFSCQGEINISERIKFHLFIEENMRLGLKSKHFIGERTKTDFIGNNFSFHILGTVESA